MLKILLLFALMGFMVSCGGGEEANLDTIAQKICDCTAQKESKEDFDMEKCMGGSKQEILGDVLEGKSKEEKIAISKQLKAKVASICPNIVNK